MEQVLPSILEFADFATLKTARQVCSLWNREATPKLLAKSRICVPRKVHMTKGHQTPDVTTVYSQVDDHNNQTQLEITELCDEDEFDEQVISTLVHLIHLSFPFHPLHLHIAHCTRALPYNVKLPALLSSRRVTTLKYSAGNTIFPCCYMNSTATTQDLAKILGQLPRLKELYTTCLDLQLHRIDDLDIENEDENENGNHGHGENWREGLLKKLESLDKIYLDFWLSSSHLRNFSFLGATSTWTNRIRSVRVNHEQILRLFVGLQLDWPLTNVELMLENQVDVQVVRQFLDRISGTLTHLHLAFFVSRRRLQSHVNNNPRFDINNEIDLGQGLSRCHIPPNLSQLTSLQLEMIRDEDDDLSTDDEGHLEFNMWKNFAAGLQLINLKKLEIRGNVSVYFDAMLQEWISVCPGRILRGDFITEISLWPSTFKSPTILFRDLWPNLSSLTVSFNLDEIVTRIGVFGIFSEMSANLEKLEIHLLLKPEICRRSRNRNPDFYGDSGQSEKEKDVEGESRYQPLNCDELLTGIKCPGNYGTRGIMPVERLAHTNFKSVRNLESLRYLKVKSATCCAHHGLTDFSLYNGLLFVKTLQNIEINRKFISDRAVSDMNIVFGRNVNLRLL